MANSRSPSSPLAGVVARNIDALLDAREEQEQQKTLQDRIADMITRFTGSMAFVYFHLIWFGGWIVLNLKWLPVKPFDPYPFGLLTMIGSLEAIFLSTFVLISQNRMAAADDKRANLDVQIGLLAEHEITRILEIVDAMAQQMGVQGVAKAELEELKQDVVPEAVLNELEQREKQRDLP